MHKLTKYCERYSLSSIDEYVACALCLHLDYSLLCMCALSSSLPSVLSLLAILKTVYNICFGEKKRYVLNTDTFFFKHFFFYRLVVALV